MVFLVKGTLCTHSNIGLRVGLCLDSERYPSHCLISYRLWNLMTMLLDLANMLVDLAFFLLDVTMSFARSSKLAACGVQLVGCSTHVAPSCSMFAWSSNVFVILGLPTFIQISRPIASQNDGAGASRGFCNPGPYRRDLALQCAAPFLFAFVCQSRFAGLRLSPRRSWC